MSRTMYVLVPLLILLATPCVLAQVTSDPPTPVTMTDAQLREARTDMQNRMDRLDTDFRDLERQAASISDPQQRSEMDRQLEQFRQQHGELRTQADELATADATTFSTERQGLMDRYNEFDRSLQQARLSAASTPQAYRRLSTDQLGRVDRDLAAMNQRLDRLPEMERARLAYDLIQLRKQRDELTAQNRRLARTGAAEFDTMRRQQTQTLSRLNTDLHSTMMRHDAMAHDGMRQVQGEEAVHGGGQVQDRDQVQDQTQQDQMQQDRDQMQDLMQDQDVTPPTDSLELRPEDRVQSDGSRG